MKIFSNFDTKFRQRILNDALEHFSYDEILILTRSRYYLYFYILFYLFVYSFFYIALLVFFLQYIDVYNTYIISISGFIFLIILWFRVGHKLLKYLFDFTIITPSSIFTFKQKGILNSVMKEIPTSRIRSIQVSRNSLLENMFHYGSIDMQADFAENPHLHEDNEVPSVIGLTFVDRPLEVKNRISDICYHA